MISTQSIPQGLEISKFLPGSHFADSYVATNLWPQNSAMDIFLKTVGSPPGWVSALMRLRNQLVQLVGLKNLGGLQDVHHSKAASDYKVGERAGIFTVLYLSESEAVLGDNDKHLEVRLSVSKQRSSEGVEQIAVTTIVREHNRLGKLYMLAVGPMHRLIAPAVMKRGLKPEN